MFDHEPPIETIHLNAHDKRRLLEQIDRQSQPGPGWTERRGVRVGYPAPRALVRVIHPSGSTAHYSVLPRNLSRRGLAFVHGRFLYPDSACELKLPMLSGQWHTVAGRVLRCRHVSGLVHEVSVLFAEAINLAVFATLTGTEQLRHQEEQEQAARSAAVGQRKRVLVLDPFQSDRRLLAHWMGSLGLLPTEAKSAAEATRAMRDTAFDMVVAELRLEPEGGGAWMRSLRAWGYDGPVVAVSAAEGEAVEQLALDAGANVFLVKPCDGPTLRVVVEQLLSLPREPALYSTLGNATGLRPLLADFVQSLAGHMAELREAAETRDVRRLAAVCWQLKGAGGGHGFAPITREARQVLALLERRPMDFNALHAGVADLIAVLRRVRVR